MMMNGKPSYLYCKHDNFIGGVGIDYICGLCEDEAEAAIEEAIANSNYGNYDYDVIDAEIIDQGPIPF
jgi:hypothetical protein